MNWIIVGLGNPGDEYQNSRHNIGREVVEEFAKKQRLPSFVENGKLKALETDGKVGKEKAQLLLPETFMNKSGTSLKSLVTSKKKAEKLVVAHDDLDLPLGVMKIVFGRGSGGHKGVESIKKAVKTNEFTRLRIGIAKGDSKGRAKNIKGEEAVRKFVLGKFTPAENKEVKKTKKKATEALEVILTEGRSKAMNLFN